MNDSNRLLGLITMAAGAAVLLLCRSIETIPDTRTLSAVFFPELLAVLLLLFGAGLALLGGGKSLDTVAAKIFQPANFCLAAFTLLYACSFGFGDYRLSTPVYVAASMWVLGVREPVRLVLIPVLSTAVMYGLFRYGFTVLLPTLF